MVTKNKVFVAALLFFTFAQASESKEICTTYDANDFNVISSEEDQPFEIPLYKNEDNKEIKLLHENREFFICNETKKSKVNSHRINKDIRSVNTAHLKKMLQKGYLVVSQSEEGEYKIDINARLKGGGAFGAMVGAIFGKALVHFIGHGTIHCLTLCTGPAYAVTLASLEAALLPTVIMPWSTAAAIGFGVIGGTLTGPV